MTIHWKLASSALAAAAIIATAGVANAETSAVYGVDTGTYTRADVPAADPFGTLPVDVKLNDIGAIDGFLTTLSSAQKTELNERCAVVTDSSAHTYGTAAETFCADVFASEGVTPATPTGDNGNDAGSAYHDTAGNVTNDAYNDL